MTKIHIFLGSSLDELHLDSETMGNYVRKLNDIYMDRDIWIQLDRGDELEEYNEEIQQSDIFLVLFYNQAGQDTIEQFHKALERFQSAGAPAILTFFRQGEGYDPKQSVLKFMDELGEQLGHYFKKYTHIDTVKLVLLLQMKLMKLDVPIEVEESVITVAGKQVLTLENIPMWAENIDFQSLKKQYQACERAYLDAKAATTDPITDPVFLRASEQWHEAKKALRELEQKLFAIALKIEEKNNDGTLTERERKAYELMEQGDTEGAGKIMDLREILDDAKHIEAWKQQMNQQADEKLEQNVQELLLRIEILKTQVQNPSRFEEIQETFEEAVGIEKRNHLKKIAMREYVSYLDDQNDYARAIPLAERYLEDVEHRGDKSQIADAANILGVLYSDTNRMNKAEQEYLRAKEIREQLAAENPSAYQPDLAMSCNNLGVLYKDTNRMDLAEREYLRAKEIYEQLTAENPLAYLSDLATSCNNLGVLYKDTNRMDKAEQEYLGAKEIYEQLATEYPAVYQSYLASTCNNLGILYAKTNRLELAEQEHLRAKEIQEQLAAENPSAYQPDLASSCNNLGVLYQDTNCMDKAEQEHLLAKGIYEQLAAENPSVYRSDLAMSYNNLGILYADTNRMDKAEQEYLRAKEIQEQLAIENPSVYRLDLADTCNNLGILYIKTNHMELAEQEYLRAKEIYEQLSAGHPSVYRPDLADTCNNLGVLYCKNTHMDKAEQEYLRAKKIYEQLTAEHPSAYQSVLANTCYNLGNLYSDTNRMDKAEQEYLRAKEIQEQLASEHPSVYQPDLANTCNNLGNLYSDTNRMDKAEQEYLRAKEIYERLSKISPGRYMLHLQMVCNNLEQLKNTREKRGFFARLFSRFKK